MVAYSFKSRFVTPIQVGLGIQQHIPGTEYVPKRQTIRAVGKRRHARPGETLQLYFGMRTRGCFLIGTARCSRVGAVNIYVVPKSIAAAVDGRLLGPSRMEEFSRQDGFDDRKDMHAFWLKEHGIGLFEMVLIEWEPMK